MNELFRRFAHRAAELLGTPWAFILALAVVAVWALTGPVFSFSNTWQLIINTSTTIVTFLMVFLIQSTQNRDNKAVQLKLDELIRAVKGARSGLVDLEDLTDADLDRLQQQFQALREHAGELVQVMEAAGDTRDEVGSRGGQAAKPSRQTGGTREGEGPRRDNSKAA